MFIIDTILVKGFRFLL